MRGAVLAQAAVDVLHLAAQVSQAGLAGRPVDQGEHAGQGRQRRGGDRQGVLAQDQAPVASQVGPAGPAAGWPTHPERDRPPRLSRTPRRSPFGSRFQHRELAAASVGEPLLAGSAGPLKSRQQLRQAFQVEPHRPRPALRNDPVAEQHRTRILGPPAPGPGAGSPRGDPGRRPGRPGGDEAQSRSIGGSEPIRYVTRIPAGPAPSPSASVSDVSQAQQDLPPAVAGDSSGWAARASRRRPCRAPPRGGAARRWSRR